MQVRLKHGGEYELPVEAVLALMKAGLVQSAYSPVERAVAAPRECATCACPGC